jgi:hypothetical protein
VGELPCEHSHPRLSPSSTQQVLRDRGDPRADGRSNTEGSISQVDRPGSTPSARPVALSRRSSGCGYRDPAVDVGRPRIEERTHVWERADLQASRPEVRHKGVLVQAPIVESIEPLAPVDIGVGRDPIRRAERRSHPGQRIRRRRHRAGPDSGASIRPAPQHAPRSTPTLTSAVANATPERVSQLDRFSPGSQRRSESAGSV